MSNVNEWLKQRRTIHNAATEGPWEVDADGWIKGSGKYAVRADVFEHSPVEVPPVIYNLPGDGAAIVDAHNTLPALLTAVEKMLEVCDKALAVKVEGSDEGDAAMAAMASVVRRAIEGAINE